MSDSQEDLGAFSRLPAGRELLVLLRNGDYDKRRINRLAGELGLSRHALKDIRATLQWVRDVGRPALNEWALVSGQWSALHRALDRNEPGRRDELHRRLAALRPRWEYLRAVIDQMLELRRMGLVAEAIVVPPEVHIEL